MVVPTQPLTRADLLWHPIRWRIVGAMRDQARTAGELAVLLPEVPQTTLYRHLRVLAEAGVLRVVDERRIRGTVERRYVLDEGGAAVEVADIAQLGAEEILDRFTLFVRGLAEDVARFLARPTYDLRDTGFSQDDLYLDREELARLKESIDALIAPLRRQGPAPHRQHLLLTRIVYPLVVSPGQEAPSEEETSP